MTKKKKITKKTRRPATRARSNPPETAVDEDVPDRTGPLLKISSSRQFPGWLGEQKMGLAFTTYQAGRLFMVGRKEDGGLSYFERRFDRCMGLWADSETLYMSAIFQIWRFRNALDPGQTHNGYDRLFIPRVGYTTGDIDAHDIAVDADGRVIFVNTVFSCLATISEDYSFHPIWRPPFISSLAAEDRCHLNGLAMANGKPRYVTAASQSDVADGWRDRRHDGGCVIDIESNEIVVSGLSMPHSPRLYRDKLWLLDSGTGYFGSVDLEAGRFEPMTFCPGYARGLCFSGNYAIVGLSKPRDGGFEGLELQNNLAKRDGEARCGLVVIDLASGDIIQWIRLEGVIEELYDVVTLPGARRPMSLGFKTDEIHRMISAGEEAALSVEPARRA